MSEIVKINPQEYGLTETKAKEIEAMFIPMLNKMAELEEEFNKVMSEPPSNENCIQAKELRLKYVKVRTGTAEIHKQAKDFYLKGGRFVDGWKNAQLFASQSIEEKLEAREKHFINIEREKREQLAKDRQSLLIPFTEIFPEGLGTMAEDVFSNYLTGVKIAHEAKIKAEKEAEEQRLAAIEAEKKRQKEIEEENKRLKKEAEAKQIEFEIERKKQAEILRKQQEEQEKERKRLEAIALEEKRKQQELQDELRKKQEEENRKNELIRQEEKRKKEEEKKAAKAPDKDKLKSIISSLTIPEFDVKQIESQAVKNDIILKFNGFKNWALLEIEKL